MEPPYAGDVTRHGPNGQVLVTTGAGLLDGPVDEKAADALITGGLGYDDWLNLTICASVEQTSHADDFAAKVGYPQRCPLRHGQVVIESGSGVVAADRWVSVDPSVVLS